MKTCKEIVEHAAEYTDKRLAWYKVIAYRFHLLMCKHCRHFVRQYQLLTSSIPKILRPKATDQAKIEDMYTRVINKSNSP